MAAIGQGVLEMMGLELVSGESSHPEGHVSWGEGDKEKSQGSEVPYVQWPIRGLGMRSKPSSEVAFSREKCSSHVFNDNHEATVLV